MINISVLFPLNRPLTRKLIVMDCSKFYPCPLQPIHGLWQTFLELFSILFLGVRSIFVSHYQTSLPCWCLSARRTSDPLFQLQNPSDMPQTPCQPKPTTTCLPTASFANVWRNLTWEVPSTNFKLSLQRMEILEVSIPQK